MKQDVVMPKMGMMNNDVKIVQWYVKIGDKVTVGQDLCDIESQKITQKLQATVDGEISEINYEEGDEVAIGTVIARII